MKKLNLTLKNFILLFLMAGCTSSTLKVESDPSDAEVHYILSGQAPRRLGKTPLTVSPPSNKPYQIGISKENFETSYVVLPSSLTSDTTEVFIILKESVTGSQANLSKESINKVVRGVAESQKLIKNKDYEQAESLLLALKGEFSFVSVIYDLLGNVYYLKKDIPKALDSYKKSSQLQPGNPDTDRMIRRLEQMSLSGGSIE